MKQSILRAGYAVGLVIGAASERMRGHALLVGTLIVASQVPWGTHAAPRPRGDWPGLGHDPQHSAVAVVAGQRPLHVRWSTPVDLAPQYWGDQPPHPLRLAAGHAPEHRRRHREDGRDRRLPRRGPAGATGALVWTVPTDYTLPPHNWVPSVGPVLARGRTRAHSRGGRDGAAPVAPRPSDGIAAPLRVLRHRRATTPIPRPSTPRSR